MISPREIWTINNSTAGHALVVTESDLEAAVVGFQEQMDMHFGPAWNEYATYVIKPPGTIPPRNVMVLEFRDRSNEKGALGYHMDETQPYSIVGIQDCVDDNMPWTECGAHEGTEMTHDPECSKCRQVGRIVLSDEISDATEGSPYQTSNGTWVCNFVLPNWFVEGALGPYDYLGLLKAPLTLLPGGYKSSAKVEQWTQESAAHVRAAKRQPAPLSRRAKRMARWSA